MALLWTLGCMSFQIRVFPDTCPGGNAGSHGISSSFLRCQSELHIKLKRCASGIAFHNSKARCSAFSSAPLCAARCALGTIYIFILSTHRQVCFLSCSQQPTFHMHHFTTLLWMHCMRRTPVWNNTLLSCSFAQDSWRASLFILESLTFPLLRYPRAGCHWLFMSQTAPSERISNENSSYILHLGCTNFSLLFDPCINAKSFFTTKWRPWSKVTLFKCCLV